MIWEKAIELKREQKSFVLITMIGVRGSAPQEPGAKCIVTSDGLVAGTIGGGKVEATAIGHAQEILNSDDFIPPVTLTWNLQKDIKMTCGGECTFLFEHFPASPWKIAIFGAGHVSQALCNVLGTIDCQFTVVDDREEWLSRLKNIRVLNTNDPKSAVSNFDEKTFFVSMTKGHAFDVPFLFEIYKQFPNAPYVGVIGSKSKGNAIRKDLKELGVEEEFLLKLRIPIGLPLGKNVPEEISISIVSELLQVRDELQVLK